MTEERPPIAEGIIFDEPDVYLDYLHRFGFKGVGFSGGETLLAFDKLMWYIEKVKQWFGSEMYVWIYTNGDLVDETKLAGLRDAGLDEIRFNISVRRYDLKRVALARKYTVTVTVEIPAIPEDFERVKKCLVEMQKIGVDYLNLHQLNATKYNFQKLARRKYTFIPAAAFQEHPVVESEITALKLIKFAVDNDINLSINYCSHVYKARFQNLARRVRAAKLAKHDFEQMTSTGYIRRLSVKDSPKNISRIVERFRESELPETLWLLGDAGTTLAFHPSLLQHVNVGEGKLSPQYFEADIVSEDYLNARRLQIEKEIKLTPGERVFIGRKPVTQPGEPGSNKVEVSKRLSGSSSDSDQMDAGRMDTRALKDIQPFERMSTGFQKIRSSKNLLEKNTD